MEVRILGPLAVWRDGHDVDLRAAQQRRLLMLLLLRRNTAVPASALIDELWAGDPPATANKAVQVYVSQLRKALGDEAIETRPGGYLLHVPAGAVDAERFEELVDAGRSLLDAADPVGASAALQDALSLWRGPAFEELRDDLTVAAEVARLEELRVLAREALAEAEVAAGRPERAVPDLQALVREHPLREGARRLLMLALYRSGRQAEALAVFRDAQKTLRDELGIDPSPALRALEAAILAHDEGLEGPAAAWAAPVAPPSSERHASRPSVRLGDATSAAVVTPPATQTVVTLAPAATPEIAPHPDPPLRRRGRRRVVAAAAALLVASAVLGVGLASGPSAARPLRGDVIGLIGAGGGDVRSTVALPAHPTALAADADAVWAVEAAAGSVVRIDVHTREIVQTVPVSGDPSGIAVSPNGVWVAEHGENSVAWINPSTNAVVRTVPVGSGPVAVAYGLGAVWVTNADDRTLSRLDADTGVVTATIHTNAVGRGITIGGGAVWVSDEATETVSKVDPASNMVIASKGVGAGPTGLAYGAGSVWVVNAIDQTVSRLDPTTLAVLATIPVPDGPAAIAYSGGAVWVATELNRHVARLDPGTDTLAGTTATGDQPEALAAAANGGVWLGAQDAGQQHRGGRLVVVGGGVDVIDPAIGDVFPGLSSLLYDGLTSMRHVGGSAGTQLVPDLAVALPQPTDSGRTYTFHLRPGLHYSDGEPVQAADFRFALERTIALHGEFAQSFAPVVGVDRCRPRHCDLSQGVVTDDASTVVLHLTRPDPRLLGDLIYLVPVPPETAAWTASADAVPGTGPYRIESIVAKRLITLTRNPHFTTWSGAARPDGYPDEIDYRISTDESAVVRDVAAGRADLVQGIDRPIAELATLGAQKPQQVHREDQQATVFVFLNTKVAPFSDLRVRRALNFAVDRRKAAALYGESLAEPTCQLVSPTTSGYARYCPYTIQPGAAGTWSAPDLATAQRLVRSSGTRGDPVVLWSFSDFDAQASYVAGVLRGLGYPTTLKRFDDATEYFDALGRAPDAQAGLFGWFGDPLAADMFSTVTCNAEDNPARFCDRRIDARIAQLQQSEPTDPAGSAELAASIDRDITDQAPWVPLFNPATITVVSARVGNYQSQQGQVLIDQLWVH